ncbi:succinate-semialdehyde dehydrogenase (NADP(+)) [Virgibacillus indicus]|uniref:Aldehyde dehydrogenase n=1 Tax=Virgibacillus indicus TaxID=2024554 RepID=A0A265N857_9BACI|nr:NAD-dependent succinate-semialdehyde dehydrogenase [Virgibacillus indicus]OZU88017.1 succinate-semialdehyde dehydrogenase (NADP(+)) [Virgibacillus indicus]
MGIKQLYINGEWIDAVSGETYEVTNPATGEVVSEVAYGDERDAKKAIEAANLAFGFWSTSSVKERSLYLYKLYNILMEEKESLAKAITLEMGKPINESRGEVNIAAEYVLWYAEEAKRVYGEIVPASTTNKRLHVIKQPVGPVAAITPWNFPISMLTRKLAPALAAGCTAVLKPASYTPNSAIKLFECIEKAGFPKGVVNLVIGKSGRIGDEFTNNKLIRKITFTGSTAVGKKLMEAASKQVKRVSMELGGHAPFIVFEDADLEKAANGVMISKYRNSGQTCICLNRLYVHSSVKERFEKILKEKVKQLKVGNGMDETSEVGPLVDQKAYKKVESHVKDALDKGATLITGGESAKEGTLFYKPTLLSNVTEEMAITEEETFGPVCPIYEFDTEEEAIQKANDTIYGLAAYYYTKDLGKAMRVGEKLEYGIIGVNDAVPTTVQAPFGGMKESGSGREGGHQGIEGFLEEKFLSIDIE